MMLLKERKSHSTHEKRKVIQREIHQQVYIV